MSEALVVQGVGKTFGSTAVLSEVSLRVAPGSICALLGPSGSGKTTLLRVVAGLEPADTGAILLGDRTLEDAAHAISIAPEDRHIGMVFQDWAIFPHLSVAKNVGFGLPRAGRSERVGEVLSMVGLSDFDDRLPGTLSGGQQQRVALARALAPNPSVLLLDEPFSNLDVALRVQVRTELHRLLRSAGVTAVFVTHDQQEAFVLADTVAVMRAGRIVQVASPAEIYGRPVDAWTAGFVGDANLLAGSSDGAVARTEIGEMSTASIHTGPVVVLVRPEHLALERGDSATVELIEFHGHDLMAFVRLDTGTELRVRARELTVREGERIQVRFTGGRALTYPIGQ